MKRKYKSERKILWWTIVTNVSSSNVIVADAITLQMNIMHHRRCVLTAFTEVLFIAVTHCWGFSRFREPYHVIPVVNLEEDGFCVWNCFVSVLEISRGKSAVDVSHFKLKWQDGWKFLVVDVQNHEKRWIMLVINNLVEFKKSSLI